MSRFYANALSRNTASFWIQTVVNGLRKGRGYEAGDYRRHESGKSGEVVTLYVFGVPIFRDEMLREDMEDKVKRPVGFCSFAQVTPADDEYYTDD